MGPGLWLKLCELVVSVDGVVAAGLLPRRRRRNVFPLPTFRQLRRLQDVRVSVSVDLGELAPDHAVHALGAVPSLNQPSVGRKNVN